MGAIKSFWDKWGTNIVAAFKKVVTTVKIVFKTVFDAFSQFAKKVFDDIKAFWDKWGSTITETFTNILEILSEIVQQSIYD